MKIRKIFLPIFIIALVLVATIYFDVFRWKKSGDSSISGSGTIEVTEIDISSKISGRIVEITKPEGSHVKKGDLLARLQHDELFAQRLSALANLKNAEKNFKRISDLYRSGSVSRKDLDNAEAAYKMARAAMDNIDATIDYALLYSPIDGVVLENILEQGEMAFPGSVIMTVGDLSKPWIYIYVNERELGRVKIGQKVKVTIDSYPNKFFDGTVVSISNKAEFTPKTIQTKDERVKLVFAVKVAVKNDEMILKPGMPADAEIIIAEDAR
ncbi:MAG TPA: efflux RND transporter periplasmic adaptor subunit [Spirochaetota bacterium]|nr:efflux RND transporter periplasmic adaptor subunit [Spirochaetota bacterium]HOK91886.1 efflux RND transporter periplasmic adaptor subunit [Spirochaetota bacterium]HPP95407.1 efflux RND transporter periplasmic adaptor subunit [Spirochaetota bacterium]HRU65753.1 efflux RND transporter periplasmic adaptor subunit [Spirochaetota bacterium]